MEKTFKLIVGLMLLISSEQLVAQSISFMSYNIRYDNPNDKENNWHHRKQELSKLITYYHPDFLGTQEGLSHQIEYLDNQLKNYDRIGVGREDGKQKGEYTAIFYDATKFDLLKKETFWLSETSNKVSVGWDAALERICTYGEFKNKKTNEIIHVFNAHFDHQGEKSREMSVKLILDKVKEYTQESSKVVVMGDFNSLPSDKPISIFRKFFQNGYSFQKEFLYGPEGTFNDFELDYSLKYRLDYIFLKNFSINTYRHIDDRRMNNLWVSDHLPVFVTTK